MTRRVPLLIAVLATTALALSAAGSATSALTQSQLAIMVLPQSQLGAAARGLDVAIGAGVRDNFAAADDTIDPNDSAAKLGTAGRITGYTLTYDDLGMRSFVRGSGVIEVFSSANLFRSPDAADAFIGKRVADDRRLLGRYLEDGEKLDATGTFVVPPLGDRAVGVHERAKLGRGTFDTRAVLLRHGSLVLTAGIARGDGKSTEQTVIGLARALETRARQVEAGTLKERPVAVPPVGRRGVAPAGGPSLEPMALTGADISPGGTVSRQGYIADDESLATYQRELSFDGVTLGVSRLVSVESDPSLLRSYAEARGQMNLFRTFFVSPALEATLEAAIPNGEIVQRLRPAVGDEAYIAIARARTHGQLLYLAVATLRVGPVIGQLTAVFAGPRPSAGAIEAMTRTFAQRIAAGL